MHCLGLWHGGGGLWVVGVASLVLVLRFTVLANEEEMDYNNNWNALFGPLAGRCNVVQHH